MITTRTNHGAEIPLFREPSLQEEIDARVARILATGDVTRAENRLAFVWKGYDPVTMKRYVCDQPYSRFVPTSEVRRALDYKVRDELVPLMRDDIERSL